MDTDIMGIICRSAVRLLYHLPLLCIGQQRQLAETTFGIGCHPLQELAKMTQHAGDRVNIEASLDIDDLHRDIRSRSNGHAERIVGAFEEVALCDHTSISIAWGGPGRIV